MTKKAGVLGLGYAGLPLAIEICRAGYEVVGVDIDEKRIRSLSQGASYIEDITSEEIGSLVREGRFHPTRAFSDLTQVDFISICVPTPLRKTKEPDISYVANAAERTAEVLQPGQLVILESTVFPGATEEVVAPILERTGMKAGEDFYLAFSPERVDPGNTRFKVHDIPKLVGGINQASTDKAMEFYGQVFKTVVPMASAKEAEMSKLLENTFRAVNIGLVNELAIVANQMGVNLWRVIDAAATKPFGFMPFYPGPGWGGHCIPKDPVYLSWKAKAEGSEAGFIDHAVSVNNRMPTYVVSRLTDLLNDQGLSLKGSRVLLLGVAYKRDVADIRESPALVVLSLLEHKGVKVSYHDPHVPYLNGDGWWESQPLTEELLKSQDCVVITTDHTSIDYDFVVRNSKLVFDTRNATKRVQGLYRNIEVL
jgi:UDP-N-acetyl-D-glucosamine dehydrogenase